MKHLAAALLILMALACSVTAQHSKPEALTQPAGAMIEYRNAQYGFCFALHESWRGYSIVLGQWEGRIPGQHKIVARGPIISIRHARSTAEHPRQDIPIMVFTRTQWHALLNGNFFIGAAPVGPGELGRNRKHVFALPARWMQYETGWQEVAELLKNIPLRTDCDPKGKER